MRRREFMLALGGAVTVQSRAARSQTDGRMRVVGVQLGTSPDDAEQRRLVDAFVKELARLGWDAGRNLRIEYRWGAGDPQRIIEQAADLAGLAPDVIFGQGTPVTTPLRQATGTIPIVFVNVADPVGSGIVESLARPGGNLTGFTNYEESMGGKWLEILRDIAPELTRVLIVLNPGNPTSVRFGHSIERVARSLQIEPVQAPVRDQSEIERAIDAFAPTRTGGLMVVPDFTTTTHRHAIIDRANRSGAPSIFPFRLFVVSGGLAAYTIDQLDTFRRAASYVDRILRGTKPAELPVQAPTKFELIINLKTARTLRLDVPPTLLARADEVIE